MCERIYEMLEADGYHNYSCSDLTVIMEVMKTVTLILKTAMYLIGITEVFVIVGVSMVLSVNTIRDDNIIKTLREDAV